MTTTSPLSHPRKPKAINRREGKITCRHRFSLPTVVWPSAHPDGKAYHTDPIMAMLLTAGVEELMVHADAGHGDLLKQMR